MTTFFVSWELWQEMTFVLGCCIVLVFGLGLVRLWWTNRVTRRLEVLDAEKRARRSDISYCGVDTWKVDDIPFGVRAIQRGIEVDGIWISHSDSGDLSQVASSATLIADQGEHLRNKGKTPERVINGQLREQSAPEYTNTGADERAQPAPPPVWSHMPATTRLRCVAQPHFDSSELQETIDMPLTSHLDSYVPSGIRVQLLPERRHRTPTTTSEVVLSPDQASNKIQTKRLYESPVYGAARIHANRDVRRPNKGFEILPAGALGPRQELQDGGDGRQDAGNDQQCAEHADTPRGRLRKKPPVPQLSVPVRLRICLTCGASN